MLLGTCTTVEQQAASQHPFKIFLVRFIFFQNLENFETFIFPPGSALRFAGSRAS